jgi:DNA-binding transcriptional LysR family regulator
VRLKGQPRAPSDLGKFDTVAYPDDGGHFKWMFKNRAGDDLAIQLHPRISSRSAWMTVDAVLSGIAIGMAPAFLWHNTRRVDTLVELLPEWRPAKWIVQAVYPSRQGLRPTARKLLRLMTELIPQLVKPSLQGIRPMSPSAERAHPR